jgi:hypothetical protein
MNDKLNEMWTALAAYQFKADADGHGESWALMCSERTTAAAYAAAGAYASAKAAYAAGDAADSDTYASAKAAWAANYAGAAADAAADRVEYYANRSINHIKNAQE